MVGAEPGTEGSNAGVPVAALNVSAEESKLERIGPSAVRSLFGGRPVSFSTASPMGFDTAAAGVSAASSFPLAALALVFLLGEVLLAWSMGRPRLSGRESAAGS